MPPVTTCPGTTLEKKWTVSSDDFVLVSVPSIAFGLCNISLISSSLLALFYLPQDSKNDESSCYELKYPAFLYAPLFALDFTKVLFTLSHGVLLVLSAQGPPIKSTPSAKKRRFVPWLLHVQLFLSILEFITVSASLVAVFHKSVFLLQENCSLLAGRLRFARTVVILQAVFWGLHVVKVCILADPLGLVTWPSLLDQTVIKIASRYDTSGHQQCKQKLLTASRCLCVKRWSLRNRSADEGAHLFATLLGDDDPVVSDVLAGYRLLHYYQQQMIQEGKEQWLNTSFAAKTLKAMTFEQRCGIDSREDFPFDFASSDNQLLIEDLVYYMRLALGPVGWGVLPLEHPCSGTCRLCSALCCTFRCCHKRVQEQDVIGDNACMCYLNGFKLWTGILEEDILYASFNNEVYLTPFVVFLDHKKEAIVICIRGMIAMEDVLTCLTCSPASWTACDGDSSYYVNSGMYEAAKTIFDVLVEKELFTKTLSSYRDYQVIVTGHSLGGGVTSILTVLIRHKIPSVKVRGMAYSPPGGLFSFSLAEYSKSCVTTVVLGQDIVPRLSRRCLLHFKFSIKQLMQQCERPKYQVLLCGNRKPDLKAVEENKEDVDQWLEEEESFQPLFLPGRVLHLKPEASDKSSFSMTETHRENMCVIWSGVKPFTDHYPISVWRALQAYKSQQHGSIDKQAEPKSSTDNHEIDRTRLATTSFEEAILPEDSSTRSLLSCGASNTVLAEVHPVSYI